MSVNDIPTVKAWQATKNVNLAILAGIVGTLEIEDKINWRRIEDPATNISGEELRPFMRTQIYLLRLHLQWHEEGTAEINS